MDKQAQYKILETCPVMICVADPLADRLIYCNNEALSLIGERWERESISSFFSSSKEISGYIKNFSKESQKLTWGHAINGRWIVFSFLPFLEYEKPLLIITGTEITGLIYEGYFDLSKMKDPFTGIYDKKSGLQYLESFLESAKDSQSPLFSLAYLKLDCDKYPDKESLEKHIMKFVQTTSGSIRETDIFATMGNDSFIIIFPKCPVGIVENIITTIANKLDILNGLEDSLYRFNLKHSILEINEKNKDDSASVLAKAKALLNQ